MRDEWKLGEEFEGSLLFEPEPKRRVIDTRVKLNNGIEMPIVGFGTYKLQGLENLLEIVDFASHAGFRLFDTACTYGNELDLGTSLARYAARNKLTREDVFIISKLGTLDQCRRKVRKTVTKSMRNLMVDYIDMYLVHWPGASVVKVPEDDSEQHRSLRHETWEELVRLVDEEKLAAIGVSNFCARHIEELLEFSSLKPAINQVEFSPYYRQPQELLDLCAEYDIFLQAYGLFGGGDKSILYNPVILEVTKKMGRDINHLSSAQVILRWALQTGYCVLTKATDYIPIRANTELDFDINQQDMEMINCIETRRKYYWDPEDIKI